MSTLLGEHWRLLFVVGAVMWVTLFAVGLTLAVRRAPSKDGELSELDRDDGLTKRGD